MGRYDCQWISFICICVSFFHHFKGHISFYRNANNACVLSEKSNHHIMYGNFYRSRTFALFTFAPPREHCVIDSEGFLTKIGYYYILNRGTQNRHQLWTLTPNSNKFHVLDAIYIPRKYNMFNVLLCLTFRDYQVLISNFCRREGLIFLVKVNIKINYGTSLLLLIFNPSIFSC